MGKLLMMVMIIAIAWLMGKVLIIFLKHCNFHLEDFFDDAGQWIVDAADDAGGTAEDLIDELEGFGEEIGDFVLDAIDEI